MAADNPITYEEFLDNYEFKIVKKMLLREYPWVKDVFMKDPEEINKYNLIFVDVQIDPYELERLMGWRIAWYVTSRIKAGDGFWSPYVATFLKDPTDADESRELTSKINDDIGAVHKSPALPEDLRLPGTRKIQIGSFYTSPDTTIPEDTEPYPGHQI